MKIILVLKNVQINHEPHEHTWNFMFDDHYKQKARNQPKLGKKLAKGRRISSQYKNIVENVRAFFEKDKLKGSFIKRLSVVKRTAEGTGLSLRTINDQWNSSGVCKS